MFRYYSDLTKELKNLSASSDKLNKAFELRKYYLARFKQTLKEGEALGNTGLPPENDLAL